MWYSLLADLIVLLHIAFVLFVLLGGLLAPKWPRVIWLHLPALVWGAIVEFTNGVCPLTPLEQWLRTRSGESGYQGDFLLRYLLPVLYPEHLTQGIQTVLGAFALIMNATIYGWRWRKKLRAPPC
jgi:hypothetical protein